MTIRFDTKAIKSFCFDNMYKGLDVAKAYELAAEKIEELKKPFAKFNFNEINFKGLNLKEINFRDRIDLSKLIKPASKKEKAKKFIKDIFRSLAEKLSVAKKCVLTKVKNLTKKG